MVHPSQSTVIIQGNQDENTIPPPQNIATHTVSKEQKKIKRRKR